jgi:hypothetical protein
MRLVPMPDSYDLDRGLLLSVQAIQALLENKGPPVIVGIGNIACLLFVLFCFNTEPKAYV